MSGIYGVLFTRGIMFSSALMNIPGGYKCLNEIKNAAQELSTEYQIVGRDRITWGYLRMVPTLFIFL